jgi:hypothetical protein
MTKEESLKLFRYFQQEFKKINGKLDTTASKADIDTVLVILDGMKGQLEDSSIELAATKAQTTRHETWLLKAAKKISLPYRSFL